MPRKNSRVRSRNVKRDRRQPGEPRGSRSLNIPRVPVENLVLPDGQCYLNRRRPKARFGTKAKAEKALAQAQQQRERMGSAHVEKRVYPCPQGGCGGWHLTSREAYDEDAWKRRKGQS